MSLASSLHAGPGTYALLVGSGVSNAAGVPTGWDVTLDLVKRYATGLGEDPGEDLIGWYRNHTGGEPDYPALLEDLAPSPEDRRNLLEGYFEPTDEERDEGVKMPTAAHRAIAALVEGGFVKVIVTPNFDRLLELALARVGVQPTVISSAAHAEGALPLVHSDCTIVKVHGDYLSPDLKNTVEELERYEPVVDALLDRVFDEYGLVVCGWSATWDTALRNALLRAPNRRFATYWMHRGDLSDHAQELIASRGAVSMRIADADTAFEQIGQTVAALAEVADQQPQDTAAAVARLKRYLPDPVHRIRLTDLVTTETERLISRLADLPASVFDVPAIYEDRVRTYEEATARLAALLAVGARFSDAERHDQLWTDTVKRPANRPLIASARVPLINMHQYPTLLAMYAVALGSATADRVEPIACILSTVTAEFQNSPMPILATVNTCTVLDEDLLKQNVEGFAQARFPVSLRLFQVLQPVASALMLDDERYAAVFDEVEYLFGVTYGLDTAEGEGPMGLSVLRGGLMDPPPDRLATRHRDLFIKHGIFNGTEYFDSCCATYKENYRKACLQRWEPQSAARMATDPPPDGRQLMTMIPAARSESPEAAISTPQ